MVYAKPVYASIGLSIGRAALEAIGELATPEYFGDPVGFIAERWAAGSDVRKEFGEPQQVRASSLWFVPGDTAGL